MGRVQDTLSTSTGEEFAQATPANDPPGGVPGTRAQHADGTRESLFRAGPARCPGSRVIFCLPIFRAILRLRFGIPHVRAAVRENSYAQVEHPPKINVFITCIVIRSFRCPLFRQVSQHLVPNGKVLEVNVALVPGYVLGFDI